MISFIDETRKHMGGKSILIEINSGVKNVHINYMRILFMKLNLEFLCINIYAYTHSSVFQ